MKMAPELPALEFVFPETVQLSNVAVLMRAPDDCKVSADPNPPETVLPLMVQLVNVEVQLEPAEEMRMGSPPAPEFELKVHAVT